MLVGEGGFVSVGLERKMVERRGYHLFGGTITDGKDTVDELLRELKEEALLSQDDVKSLEESTVVLNSQLTDKSQKTVIDEQPIEIQVDFYVWKLKENGINELIAIAKDNATWKIKGQKKTKNKINPQKTTDEPFKNLIALDLKNCWQHFNKNDGTEWFGNALKKMMHPELDKMPETKNQSQNQPPKSAKNTNKKTTFATDAACQIL